MTQRLFTNAQFAQRAALIATKAAKWARDLLDDAAAPASPTRVEEFGSAHPNHWRGRGG